MMSSGIGQSMWQVIAGRIISGLGAAGMTVIVSILITGASSMSLLSWAEVPAKFIRPGAAHPSSSMEKLRQCRCHTWPEYWRPTWRLTRGYNWMAMVIHRTRTIDPACNHVGHLKAPFSLVNRSGTAKGPTFQTPENRFHGRFYACYDNCYLARSAKPRWPDHTLVPPGRHQSRNRGCHSWVFFCDIRDEIRT